LLVFYNSHTHSIMVVCFVNWLLMLVYVFRMMALFKEFLSNFERNSCKAVASMAGKSHFHQLQKPSVSTILPSGWLYTVRCVAYVCVNQEQRSCSVYNRVSFYMPTLQFLLLRTIQGRTDPFSARSYQQTCCIARVVPYITG